MTALDGATAVLWDWNGTLLDDTASCVGALDAMLARRGLETVGIDFFRDNFSFPARDFYALVGIRLENEDWDALAAEYHREYLTRPAGLAPDAEAALALAASSGAVQYVLSAMRSDILEKAVADAGIRGFFRALAGTDNIDGAGKLDVAIRFADSLRRSGVRRLAVIGDSLHDAEVARAIGASCALYGGGSHSPSRLAAAAPVAATLCEAAGIVLGEAGRKRWKGISGR